VKTYTLLIAVALGAFLALPTLGHTHQHEHMQVMNAPDSSHHDTGGEYPLQYCIVSGQPLGSMGGPVDYIYNGRDLKFCCNVCLSSFKKEPDKYLKRLDAAIIEAQKGSYPYTTCPVTGVALDSVANPVDIVYNNHLVRLSSSSAAAEFQKDPEKYMSILHSSHHEGMEMPDTTSGQPSHEMEMHHDSGHDHGDHSH